MHSKLARGLSLGLIGLGLMMVIGGGLLWLGRGPAAAKPSASGVAAHTSTVASTAASVSPNPAAPTATSATAPRNASATARLGTAAWAAALRATLSHQWGSAAPPLWIAPDPVHTQNWIAVAPLAHHGSLWWAEATPDHPLPAFQAVSATLNLTNAQIAGLPLAMRGALKQAYDLIHLQPWALRSQPAPVHSRGAMTPQQAEANGTTRDPVAWEVTWTPPMPAYPGIPAQPGATNFVVIMPWQNQGLTPVLVSEGMTQRTTGAPYSDALVRIQIDGQTMQDITVTDTAAFVPGSVQAGLGGPGLNG